MSVRKPLGGEREADCSGPLALRGACGLLSVALLPGAFSGKPAAQRADYGPVLNPDMVREI